MDFLRYIEYDAENLQFFLWYKDYCQRFDVLPENERRLAPEWTAEQALAERTNAEKEKPKKVVANQGTEALKGSDFDPNEKLGMPAAAPNPFNTPPRTPSAADQESVAPSTVGYSDDFTLRTGITDHSKRAETAFEEAGALQPCKRLH
jgi:hypothetical protein